MQFAPVCRLDTGALAAVELQLRGPARSQVSTAAALRRAARMMDQHRTLDRRTRDAATTDDAQATAKVLPLLVPLDLDLLDDLDPSVVGALERHVLVVLPEALERSPQQTLAKVARARTEGRIVCVDGLATPDQAATLLSLIEPDIVVTGPDLVNSSTSPQTARLAHALAAHVERSHAVIIAEGVDTEAQRVVALTLGAAYGIGRLYPPVEDPSSFADATVVDLPDMPVWSTPDPELNTPFAIASVGNTPRRGDKRLLIEMSKALESQAAASGSAVALGTFQYAEHFTEATAKRWREMSEQTGMAGVYGVGLVDVRDGNVHRAPLNPDDELVEEWNVAVLGPHFAALLSARDLHTDADGDGADLDRDFDFVQSYDRLTVTQAVHSILRRFA